MSRNNVIVVANFRRRRGWFVIGPLDIDGEYNSDYVSDKVDRCQGIGHSRGKALLLAFDLQKQWNTEYGVREMKLV